MSRFLKLCHNLKSSGNDIYRTVSDAQSLPAYTKVSKDIAAVGRTICNGARDLKHPQQLYSYAAAVTEHDIHFLEKIKEDVCQGMDLFDTTGGEVSSFVFYINLIVGCGQRSVSIDPSAYRSPT